MCNISVNNNYNYYYYYYYYYYYFYYIVTSRSSRKTALANSVDPDETPHDAASHLGLRCLLKGICVKFLTQICSGDIIKFVKKEASTLIVT
ncbi:hypothetical protein DPMN_036579 [Dreissena polymorpha]|uniref:Uncharacterized protein n=1 Tax=Dreissena polymorpha TaxID=45954 RepID=A0A9D4RP02_DREPO|nr:hypothetical protein DPMN_036579 [Dreissena polymorpha]